MQTTNETNENEIETDHQKQISVKCSSSTLTPPPILPLQSNYKLDIPRIQKEIQIPHLQQQAQQLQQQKDKKDSLPQILFKSRPIKSKKDSMESKRERKAAKTLAIVRVRFSIFLFHLYTTYCYYYYQTKFSIN